MPTRFSIGISGGRVLIYDSRQESPHGFSEAELCRLAIVAAPALLAACKELFAVALRLHSANMDSALEQRYTLAVGQAANAIKLAEIPPIALESCGEAG